MSYADPYLDVALYTVIAITTCDLIFLSYVTYTYLDQGICAFDGFAEACSVIQNQTLDSYCSFSLWKGTQQNRTQEDIFKGPPVGTDCLQQYYCDCMFDEAGLGTFVSLESVNSLIGTIIAAFLFLACANGVGIWICCGYSGDDKLFYTVVATSVSIAAVFILVLVPHTIYAILFSQVEDFTGESYNFTSTNYLFITVSTASAFVAIFLIYSSGLSMSDMFHRIGAPSLAFGSPAVRQQ